MSNFEFDSKKAAFVGGRLETTGAYTGSLTNCYKIVSKGGAEGVVFDAATDGGQSVSWTIWTVAKNGNPIDRGLSAIHGLMSILDLQNLKENSSHTAEVYDFELKGMVTKKVVGYPQAINKPVGFMIQMEWNNYLTVDGVKKSRLQPVFVGWYDATTGATPREKITGVGVTAVKAWAESAPIAKGVNEALRIDKTTDNLASLDSEDVPF